MKIVDQSVELLWVTPDAEKMIEAAGRTCYRSGYLITDDSAAKFAKRMTDLGHHAMIEHAVASMRIVTNRGISHEIVRHRICSFAQESSRWISYKSKGGEITFIEPTFKTPEEREVWVSLCEESERAYMKLIELGAAPQWARSVLPNSTKTEIVMTCNFREWMHFIKLRTSKTAHPEIRWVANECLKILKKHSPSVFGSIPEVE
ncbi:MAG: FAD-dependent thymidylate synthase [Balneolaceae bacterium]